MDRDLPVNARVSHTMTVQKATDQGGASLDDIGRRFIWISTILAALSVPAVLVVDQSLDHPEYLWVLVTPLAFILLNLTLLVRKTYRVDISLGLLVVTAAFILKVPTERQASADPGSGRPLATS